MFGGGNGERDLVEQVFGGGNGERDLVEQGVKRNGVTGQDLLEKGVKGVTERGTYWSRV